MIEMTDEQFHCDLCGRPHTDLEGALRCCGDRLDDGRFRADGGSRDVCATCGIEMIGGRCLTRGCEDRHSSVDEILGGESSD